MKPKYIRDVVECHFPKNTSIIEWLPKQAGREERNIYVE